MNHSQSWLNAISQAAVRQQYRILPGGQTLHSLKSEKPLTSSNLIFITETIGSQQYLFPRSLPYDGITKNSAYLLPSYDEYLISYRDRSSSLSAINNNKTVSVNGIFFPSIIINGQVAGLWQRKIKNSKVSIETNLFQPLSRTNMGQIEKQAVRFGRFLDKEAEIRI